jgi:hypothetical protein
VGDWVGNTPLDLAVGYEYVEIVALLLPKLKNVTIKNIDILLSVTCYTGNIDILKLLLKNGAHIGRKTLKAAFNYNQENPEIKKYLDLTLAFDKWKQTGQYFNVPQDDGDLREFAKKLLSSKRANKTNDFFEQTKENICHKMKVPKLTDCRIKTVRD